MNISMIQLENVKIDKELSQADYIYIDFSIKGAGSYYLMIDSVRDEWLPKNVYHQETSQKCTLCNMEDI